MKKVTVFAFNGELMCFVHALLDDMSGHPGMARYLEEGYEVIAL